MKTHVQTVNQQIREGCHQLKHWSSPTCICCYENSILVWFHCLVWIPSKQGELHKNGSASLTVILNVQANTMDKLSFTAPGATKQIKWSSYSTNFVWILRCDTSCNHVPFGYRGWSYSKETNKRIFLYSYILIFLHSYILIFLHSYAPIFLYFYILILSYSYILTFLCSYILIFLYSYTI